MTEAQAARLKRRHAAERRFRAMGLIAIILALGFLGILLATIVTNGASAFRQTRIAVDVAVDAALIGPDADWQGLAKTAIAARFPQAESRQEKRELSGLLSSGAADELRTLVSADPSVAGQTRRVWLTAKDTVDMTVKGYTPRDPGSPGAKLSDRQLAWIAELERAGDLALRFNTRFLTAGDSREPEQAGVWGAIVGSLYALAITLAICFPVGVAAAIYLEEFAPRNRLTDIIEVNINNLAAVPSVVFGLLGLAVFLNAFHMPRSAPLVGGLVLALMSLPTIIIAARASLKAVPPSIRQAALALGASELQMVIDHVLPLAMPGVFTGTILGMARALGETAPLLMIGMVAFIVDIPTGPLEPASALPVQVYLWANSPERAFVEKTSAAIIVLLAVLAVMNLTAIFLRKKFERRW
jgi:phosphate transport system permease protein